MQYDGTGKLAEAIAALFGLSPKSQKQISDRIREAKAGLGVTSKSKLLPNDVKLAIYQWHYDRLNPVCDIQQADDIQGTTQSEAAQDSPIQDVKQTENPDAVTQEATDDNPETQTDSSVYDVKQNARAQPDDDMDSAVYDFEKVHFAVNLGNRRTTVMMEGYLVKALQRKHGLVDNPAIRAWIEQAIKSDGLRFDRDAPLTRQVKRIVMESFV
ncbi:MAG: hypothetical protein NTY50_04405 [Methylobacter sp.]|nr:hypothetical protein [Methylobacter sp.]